MNKLRALAVFFLLFAISSAAQEPTLPLPPDNDPFVGTWQANREKSKPKLSKKDAAYTRTIARDGDELVFSSQAENPEPSSNRYRIRCDGQFHSVPFGFLSCKHVASNRIEGETKGSDEHDDYWSREVSADSQEMKIFTYKNSGRTKLKSVWVLDRVNRVKISND